MPTVPATLSFTSLDSDWNVVQSQYILLAY